MSRNPKGYMPETVRVVNVKPVRHMRHLILTICTAGLWGFVWAFAVINRNMTK